MANQDLWGSELKFQVITPTYAARVAKFDEQSFARASWGLAVWEQELRRSNATYLGLIAPAVGISALGTVLAVGGVSHGIEAEISTIAVDKSMRRKGVGSALLRELLQIAKKQGAEEVFLEVRAKDGGAQALYEGFGFIRVGERKNYYPDDDAFVYRLDLLAWTDKCFD